MNNERIITDNSREHTVVRFDGILFAIVSKKSHKNPTVLILTPAELTKLIRYVGELINDYNQES